MTVVNGDVLRITAKMSLLEGDVQNVFHVLNYSGSEDDAVVWDALAARVDAAYADIVDQFTDILMFDTIQIVNLTGDALVGEDVWPTLVDGDVSGNTMPFQIAPLVLFGTDVLRSQGRKYLPPPWISAVVGSGVLFGNFKLQLAGWAAYFLTGVTAGSAAFTWGNWNPTLGRFAVWTSAFVEDRVRTQKRRFPGLGS